MTDTETKNDAEREEVRKDIVEGLKLIGVENPEDWIPTIPKEKFNERLAAITDTQRWGVILAAASKLFLEHMTDKIGGTPEEADLMYDRFKHLAKDGNVHPAVIYMEVIEMIVHQRDRDELRDSLTEVAARIVKAATLKATAAKAVKEAEAGKAAQA